MPRRNADPKGVRLRIPRSRSAPTRASRPAGIALDPVAWYRADPQPLDRLAYYGVFTLLAIAAAPVTIGVTLVALIPLALFAAAAFDDLAPARRHFGYGDLVPGIVVAESPFVVAALTDLSAAPGLSYPTVRLLGQSLDRVRGSAFATGDRVPMVAMYSGRTPAAKWDAFHPIAAAFATRDPRELAELQARIPDREWLALNEALFQIPKPYTHGHFPIDWRRDDAAWQDADRDDGGSPEPTRP